MCLRTLVGFCLSSVFLGASNPVPPAPQTVKFLNQVELQKLQEPTLSEIAEIEAALKLDNVDPVSLNRRQNVFVAFFSRDTSSQTPGHIKIPETGSFQLRLRKNANFEIVDQDATDGQAEIHMPASTLQTWLHSSQAWDEKSSLVIEDPLYYVKDTVSYSDKPWLSQKLWLKMGLRPLPVPLSWGSSEGEDYVLNFTVKAMPSFQMGWVSHKDKPAELPPGVREIGPEGGTVELPGVGKLEIPAGALSSPTTVRLIQELVVPDIQEDCRYGRVCRSGYNYISSMIRIEPINLELQVPAELSLVVSDKYKTFSDNWGPMFGVISFDSLSLTDSYIISGYRKTRFVYEPIPVLTFSYFAKVALAEIVREGGLKSVRKTE